MSDKYLETIQNTYGIPSGEYYGEWYKHDVLLKIKGTSYNVKTTRYQNTPAVPVTLVVEAGLIDLYLGKLRR